MLCHQNCSKQDILKTWNQVKLVAQQVKPSCLENNSASCILLVSKLSPNYSYFPFIRTGFFLVCIASAMQILLEPTQEFAYIPVLLI